MGRPPDRLPKPKVASSSLVVRFIGAGSRMFLSAKTIEAHLGRIYRKLGLRSRTELAALVAHEGLGAGGPPSAAAVS